MMSRPSNRQLASGLLSAVASLEDAVVAIADAAGHERLSARMGNIAVAEYGGYFVDTLPGR